MELIDRVDVNDKVIGQTTKEEAHKNGYIHRVAAIFCLTPEDRLLVQHRKKDGLLDHSVGGHVKQGESYDEAASRELKEELGLVKKLESVGVFYGNEICPRNLTYDHYFGLYKVVLTDEDVKQIAVAKEEVEKLIPMSLEDVSRNMAEDPAKYTTGFMRTFNFYIEKNNLSVPLVKVK